MLVLYGDRSLRWLGIVYCTSLVALAGLACPRQGISALGAGRPYVMTLILQVLGFLVGGVVLARILTAASSRAQFLPLAGIGLAGALVAAILFVDHVVRIGSELSKSTHNSSTVSSFAAEHDGDPAANNIFFVWVRKKMLADDGLERATYYIEPAAALKESLLDQWSSYALLPGRPTSSLNEANWLIFYGTIPKLTVQQRHQFGLMTEFSPDYFLARRTDAS